LRDHNLTEAHIFRVSGGNVRLEYSGIDSGTVN
jgi:hypothetical protein